MSAIKVCDNIYWVGAIDRKISSFHGHTFDTPRGTTYNAYLIPDDKITLIDTVYGPFFKDMIDNIREVADPAKIDYIIANHVETDHSGALPELLKLCPNAKVFGTQKCREGLNKHYYGDWDFQTVKTGDILKLGKKTLTFIEAPMLHWPDSMFTYLGEEEILFPNDAFGQHLASSEMFDDMVEQDILMEEAAKYYANILWPFSALVVKKIEELQKKAIGVKIIAPSHGVIWRGDPSKIINSYLAWGKNETLPKAVIVYETMWGSTGKMAKDIERGLKDSGIRVKLFDVNSASRTEIIKEMLDAAGFAIGSSTHNNDMLPNIAGFLDLLKGLRPKNRSACAFGSYGWAGGAAASIQEILKKAGLTIAQEPISVQYVPNEEESKRCYDYGKSFAEIIKKGTVKT